ncbi:MAG: hypothetical protein ACTTKI_10590, partial [Tannerella sp.]|uniref:hypothetical protein n=1 Tax=Tannerella sp. TaxID=2382127 RepID=UPI003FA2EBB9
GIEQQSKQTHKIRFRGKVITSSRIFQIEVFYGDSAFFLHRRNSGRIRRFSLQTFGYILPNIYLWALFF